MNLRPAWIILAGVCACAYFLAVGGKSEMNSGLDHWCTGHLMLQAETYVRTDFANPYLMPMENPFGPINDTWYIYTGWPPLFLLLLSVFLKLTTLTLFAARVFAVFWTTLSFLLVLAITRRVAKNPWALLWAGLIFVSHPIFGMYGAFVCNDTMALTWILLLILLFPGWAIEGSPMKLLAFCLLIAIGGLISWQCYVIAPCCALALAWTDWGRFKIAWQRALAPTLIALLTGVALLSWYSYLEGIFPSHYQPVTKKFLLRAGLLDLKRTAEIMTIFFSVAVMLSRFVLGTFVILLILDKKMSRPDAKPIDLPSTWQKRFYLHVLWIFPTVWFVCFPNMHQHDFQVIFVVPILAIASGYFLEKILANWTPLARRRVRGLLVAGAIGLLGYSAWLGRSLTDFPHFQRLQNDIQALTTTDTVVVVDFYDRGVWHRLQRPVVSPLAMDQVASLNPVLVTANENLSWTIPPGYAIVRSDPEYLIWKK